MRCGAIISIQFLDLHWHVGMPVVCRSAVLHVCVCVCVSVCVCAGVQRNMARRTANGNIQQSAIKGRAVKRVLSLERCVMRSRTGSRAFEGSKVENMAASEV